MTTHHFLLVEPIAKTPFPPLGLMKISTMLKNKYKNCNVTSQIGNSIPAGLERPEEIYITSLFTWDIDSVIKSVHFYQDKYPSSRINVGGIAATLLPDYVRKMTGIKPHIGLLDEAEKCSPDYTQTFDRKLNASITYTTRGCPRKCDFCSVRAHEPLFEVRNNWEKDILNKLPRIIFWDNNWLASPNIEKDCETIQRYNKIVDFNQGLDARYYTAEMAKLLSHINIYPMRFAFDDVKAKDYVINAIRLAKKNSKKDIRIYVLYNFNDSPEDFYYRINLLNCEGVLSFPMEYRQNTSSKNRYPGGTWNKALLRALRLSLLFYYRKGMITESRESFLSIYGKTPKEFVDKLYTIFEYDKSLSKSKKQ
jgi:hypothetical protein